MYELSATATRVNIVFSEGNTHATLLSKQMDITTLFMFSLFSKLPGQIVPVLQKSQGSCWPGQGFTFQGEGWRSSYREAGAPKHRSSPGHQTHGLPLPHKQNQLTFCGGLGFEGAEEKGRGRAARWLRLWLSRGRQAGL